MCRGSVYTGVHLLIVGSMVQGCAHAGVRHGEEGEEIFHHISPSFVNTQTLLELLVLEMVISGEGPENTEQEQDRHEENLKVIFIFQLLV